MVLDPFGRVSIKVEKIDKDVNMPIDRGEEGEVEEPVWTVLELHISDMCEEKMWWYL